MPHHLRQLELFDEASNFRFISKSHLFTGFILDMPGAVCPLLKPMSERLESLR
jgi:hypothetical protein